MTEQVGTEQLNDKARGEILALDKLLQEYSETVKTLRERAAANDGGRQAAAVIKKRLEGISELVINSAREGKTDRDPEEIKLVVEGIQRSVKLVGDVGQDYLQEALMLKGEARVLQSQVKGLAERKDVIIAQFARKMADREEDDAATARRNKPKRKSTRRKTAKDKAEGSNGTNA